VADFRSGGCGEERGERERERDGLMYTMERKRENALYT